MTRHRPLPALALAVLLIALAALPARAERYLSLNDPADPATFLNDHPAAVTVTSSKTTHVAWIASPGAGSPFRLYYAAFNAKADFTDLGITREETLRAGPMPVVDNTAGGGDSAADVRHPWIGVVDSSRVVILFQGKESAGDGAWALYRATFRFQDNRITGDVSVRKVVGGPGEGDVSFPTGALRGGEGAARVVYGFDNGATASGRYDVMYARLSIDNGALLAPPRALTTWNPSAGWNQGKVPLPSLSIDPNGRSHVAWVAEGPDNVLAGVWYAMVAVTGGADAVQIPPTNVIGRNRSWYRAQVHSYEESNDTHVFVTAWDNTFAPQGGSLVYVHINPDEAPRDGTPVLIDENSKFLHFPPGVMILPSSYDLFRPTATVDDGGRIFCAGSGSASSPVVYEVIAALAVPNPPALTYPTPTGFSTPYLADNPAGGLSFPAIAYYESRAFLFWPGLDNTGGARRDLNFTSVPTTRQWEDVNESGCTAAPRGGGSAIPADPLLAAAAAIPFLALLVREVRRIRGARG